MVLIVDDVFVSSYFKHVYKYLNMTSLYFKVHCKAGLRSTLRSCVSRFWHRCLRAIVCVLSAHLRGDVYSTCVCLRLREQCLRSIKTSVARVALVLLLRAISGNVEVNTLASKRSELNGNAAIVRKHRVIHKKSTCVCLRLPVAAITQKRRYASFDLWPALAVIALFQFVYMCIFINWICIFLFIFLYFSDILRCFYL